MLFQHDMPRYQIWKGLPRCTNRQASRQEKPPTLLARGYLLPPCNPSDNTCCVAIQELYFAEFDLQFFKRRSEMLTHLQKGGLQHPPGDEIYRNGNVSMFEVQLIVPLRCRSAGLFRAD